MDGVIEVEIYPNIGLRILAGGSYLHVEPRFGVSFPMVYAITWEVVDAINNSSKVCPVLFRQGRKVSNVCREVQGGVTHGVRQHQHVTAAAQFRGRHASST